MSKNVLIACPTLGLDPDPEKWLSSLLAIQNDIRTHGMGQAFLAPYRTTWWPANNQIWTAAIKYNFDYILRLDDDIWGVPDDAFSRLVAEHKDVIGAAYPTRRFPYPICALKNTTKKSLIEVWQGDKMGLKEVTGEGIQPVDLIGFGMTLIKVERFRGWALPMYEGEEICPDDTYFAQKCIDKGIQQYVHMGIKICHREVTPANRFYLFNAEARVKLNTNQIPPGQQRDELVELFGEDGLNDISTLKAIGVRA